ncbi:HNH endonuclease [Kribbella turkmenica]
MERSRRAQAVAAHRAQHGNWCPGWQRDAHAADDLTADHVTPVAAGGSESGPLQCLCRSCNSRKRDSIERG